MLKGLATLETCQVLAFALRGALDGECLYQHLALLAAGRMVGVGEFEQFDGRAVFDYERDAHAVGWAVAGIRISRPASSEARSATSNATCGTCRTRSDPRVCFETHPLHAKFAFLVADDKDFQAFEVGLARLRFSSGNSDVIVPAHRCSLSAEWHNSTLSLPAGGPGLGVPMSRKTRETWGTPAS